MAGYSEGDEENLFRANKIQRFATTPTYQNFIIITTMTYHAFLLSNL